MTSHYLKIIFRNIIRNKLYTLINLFGLSIGIGASLILLLFVQHEMSFDQFNQHKNQIFRIISIGRETGNVEAKAPFKLSPILNTEFPEIEKACRVRENQFVVKKGAALINEDHFIQVDSTFFDIFSYPIINGNSINPLDDNNSLVITRSTAKKYFPNENPVGKTLEISHRDRVYTQYITAVIEDFPANSHIQVDFILPIYTTNWGYEDINRQKNSPSFESWGSIDFMTYILVQKDCNPEQLIVKFPDLISKHIPKNFLTGNGFAYDFDLQPLTRIHLFSDLMIGDVPNKGSMKHIYLFGGIAVLILLIAIINYIILSTAKSLNRTKEIGLRKVIGANRIKIMKQVLGESIFLSILSLPFALLFAKLFLPNVNDLLGKTIELSILSNPAIILGLLSIALFVGLVAGSYIAFYLSSFKPVDVFRSQVNLGLKGSLFQKSLIVVQLMIFIGLIICSGIIYNQVQYMRKNEVLGFEKENLISIPVLKNNFSDKYLSLKAELLTNPDILYVSTNAFASSPAFGTSMTAVGSRIHKESGRVYWFSYGGDRLPEDTRNMIIYENSLVDYDYIEALGMKMAEGRTFNGKGQDDRRSIIVNEQFIKSFDVQNPLTEKYKFTDEYLNIIGIVKDYHSKSLTEKVMPVMLRMSHRIGPRYIRQLIVKMNGKNTSETLSFIENKWKEFVPEIPFEYIFTDAYIEQMYKTEMNLARLIGVFAVLAILIASLGLFGLSLFIAQKKTREIVIRKTMGASVINIILRLLKQFFGITIIANMLAMPLAWYYMDKWLQNFQYQSMMDFRIFVVAGISSILLCLITVSYHSAKAAIINPVEALKYE